MRRVLLALLVTSAAAFAQQPPPPLPPAVGNAVLLATNSIQVDRDVVITRGDVVVNDAASSPILGEKQLSIDQGVRTPRGFALKANSVDIDKGATVGGDVYYNVLQNDGAVNGALVTPLALPVISTLPTLPSGTPGTQNITLANNETRVLGTGNYGALVLGNGATLRLPGGPYTFASITGSKGASIMFDGPGEVLVDGRITLGASSTIGAGPGVTTKHKMISVRASGAAVTIGKESSIAATIFAPNGTIDADQSLTMNGSFVGRDIHIGHDSALNLRSGFRNLPPVADSQHVTVTGTSPAVITLTGSDPDLDPLTFNIGVQPTNGTLGAVLQASPTSAVVVYTPRVSDPPDAFTFRVTDSEGFFADGTVIINEGTQLPGPPATIDARDAIVDAAPGRPTIIALNAAAPPGVQVTVSIVPGSGPTFGSLGPLSQPVFNPPQPASVPYIPAPGFVGEDQFQFEACGVIDGVPVCDVGTIRVAVRGFEEGELAPDLSAEATSGQPAPIMLANSGAPPAAYSVLTLPEVGTLTDSNGNAIRSVPYSLPSPIVTYQSPDGFTGTTSFQYQAAGGQQSDFGTVTINVVPAPGSEPPPSDLAPDLTASATSGTPATISLSSNGSSTLTYKILSLPQDGTLADGNGQLITAVPYTLPSPNVTYQSSPSFTGTMTFTYGATNGTQSDTGVVSVTVTAPDNGRG